jgi:glycosyltransferase involved in cell wall biosynthesis
MIVDLFIFNAHIGMILIDALNIRKGGGLVLLNYLISSLEKAELEYVVLVNNENNETYRYKAIFNGNYLLSRNKFLKDCIKQYQPTTLFCFGNFAPNFKVKNCRVITYVHNSLMTISKKDQHLRLKLNFRNLIKMYYFIKTKNNAQLFLFQKEKVLNEFARFYGIDKQKMKEMPFFDSEQLNLIDSSVKIEDQFIYPSNYSPHKNFELLITIWEELATANYFPTLILTIDAPKKLANKINELLKKGVQIKNVGEIQHDKMLNLIAQSTFCIFPSKVESFGLGLIESSFLHCKIIVSEKIKTEILNQEVNYDINVDLIIQLLNKKIDLTKNILVDNKINELLAELLNQKKINLKS